MDDCGRAYARRVSEYDGPRKGFWYEPSGQPTSEAKAFESWALTAHQLLSQVASDYHATISVADLATQIQTQTQISTSRPAPAWVPKVLGPLSVLCARSGEPPLTALVVGDYGWVGEAYDEVLRSNDQRPISDWNEREKHASAARLECYQWAGSAPAGGGVAASVRQALASGKPKAERAAATPRRTPTVKTTSQPRVAAPKPARRVAASDKPIAICQRCYMALLPTGVCENCD